MDKAMDIEHEYKGYVYKPLDEDHGSGMVIKHNIWFGHRLKFHDTNTVDTRVMTRSEFEDFIDSHIQRRMERLRSVKVLLVRLGDPSDPEYERAMNILDEFYEEERCR